MLKVIIKIMMKVCLRNWHESTTLGSRGKTGNMCYFLCIPTPASIHPYIDVSLSAPKGATLCLPKHRDMCTEQGSLAHFISYHQVCSAL